ncbi:MAG: ATP dependent DNA ligase domain protein [Methanosaeta sp. PtaU1.Bin060]|jgi:putative ATP-dependent DNA ligase|nr:MAG: ATP dependent DNA ligase domain protein [Methanosaeta sp. PtaU1.Bin060]
MNLGRAAERLGITEERLQGLQETLIKRSSWPEPRLLRFEKTASGIEAGTVIFENGEIVYGYQKIRRALMLGPAIKRHFSGIVAVEEKMNGHNVRVTSVDGSIIALTRGGFICPYSTEVAKRLLPEAIFEEQPDLVLCGEMVGPENPYVPKDIYPTDTIDFYLFDLSRKNCKSTLGVHRTHEFAREHGIKAAALLGEFRAENAYEPVTRMVRRLGRQGREGVVMKDPENRRPPMKYTSSESNCNDLRVAFRYYNDYALDFFLSRAVREGFQSLEWRESEEERRARAKRLGESILLPMVETIQKKQSGENIVQRVQIRVKSLQTAREFEYHLRRSGMKAIFDQPEPEDDGYLVRITRLIMSTNDKTQALLEGEMW